MSLSIYFVIVLAAILILLSFVKYKQNHWKNHNVPYVPPMFPWGNFIGLGRRINISLLLDKFYKQLKGRYPFGGLYIIARPIVIALDLDFIKHILIKDFNYFQTRGLYYNERDDPLSAHLVAIDGQKWRNLRTKLTPTFTSGKMKVMFMTMLKTAEDLKQLLDDKISENSDEVEMKDILGRFTTDIIGTCAFGIECNSLKDANAEFRMMGKKVFEEPRHTTLKRILMNSSHSLGRFLRIKLINDNVSKFFHGIVKETVEFREANNIERNDFMDLLIQLKNHAYVDDSSIDGSYGNLTLNEIAAQAYVFFLAGFETSSTLLSFCLFELSLNQDIQQKVREEIETVMKRCNGQISYESIKEMPYMEQVLNESLRKYPPIGSLPRRATADYQVPGTNYTIRKGQIVFIPIYAIHHDPELYPDPEKFDPNRFRSEEMKQRHPIAFLPFGEGPRNCIGLRFGLMQARIGVFMLIRNFKFELSARCKVPIEIRKDSHFLSIDGGLWLRITPAVNCSINA